MSETIGTKVARLEERTSVVLEHVGLARDAMSRNEEELKKLLLAMHEINYRLKTVETQLASNAPTIEEFITIKHQVKGGGRLAKWAWGAGGIIIAALYASREAIRSIFG